MSRATQLRTVSRAKNILSKTIEKEYICCGIDLVINDCF